MVFQPCSEQNHLQAAVSTMMSASPRSRIPQVMYSIASIAKVRACISAMRFCTSSKSASGRWNW